MEKVEGPDNRIALSQGGQESKVPHKVDRPSEGWGDDEEKEFLEFVKKRALGLLTSDESGRLKLLEVRRRQERSYRSYDEMCAQRETSKRLSKLLKAINSYADHFSNGEDKTD